MILIPDFPRAHMWGGGCDLRKGVFLLPTMLPLMLGKSQVGAHKQSNFQQKRGQKSFLENQALSVLIGAFSREWPRYCREVYWIKMVQTGQNDHFGQNDPLFRTGFWHSRDQNGPFWSHEVSFGPFRSANRTLATPAFQGLLEPFWGRSGPIPPHLTVTVE